MVPFVNPVTVYDVCADNEIGVVIDPPDIKYPVIERPPLSLGTLQLKVDCAFSLDVAVNPVGALGTVDGVADNEVENTGALGFAFTAATLKLYVMPFVNPVTV